MNSTEEHLIRLLAELDAPTQVDLRSLLPTEKELIATLDRLLAQVRS
jgi:hypothetical protein